MANLAEKYEAALKIVDEAYQIRDKAAISRKLALKQVDNYVRKRVSDIEAVFSSANFTVDTAILALYAARVEIDRAVAAKLGL